MKVVRNRQFILVTLDVNHDRDSANFGPFVDNINKMLQDGEKIISITPLSHIFDQDVSNIGYTVTTNRQTSDTLLLLVDK